MTDQQYIEGNELISEFMGLAREDGYHVYPTPGRGTCRAKSLQYHDNWNWIMAAWIRFRNLGLIDKGHEEWCSCLKEYLCCADDVQYFFERFLQAIKWYMNKN